MKRFLLMALLMLAGLSAWSKDYTPEQKKMVNEIMSFLRVEGFVPELDKDQDIKFKYEGKVYYACVSDADTSPMYVVLQLDYTYGETYTRQKVLNAQQEVNFYKGVKLICYDNSYSMRGEMYLTDAEQFKYVFYKLMSQIGNMQDELRKICAGS